MNCAASQSLAMSSHCPIEFFDVGEGAGTAPGVDWSSVLDPPQRSLLPSMRSEGLAALPGVRAMGEPRNRVVQVSRFGGPEGLQVVDAPMPTAGRGEVRVRVLASSIVYTDVVIRRHLYP